MSQPVQQSLGQAAASSHNVIRSNTTSPGIMRTNSTVHVKAIPSGMYQPSSTHYVAPGHQLRNGMRSTYDTAHVPTFEAPLEWVVATKSNQQKTERIVFSREAVQTLADHKSHDGSRHTHGTSSRHSDDHSYLDVHSKVPESPKDGQAKKKKFGCC